MEKNKNNRIIDEELNSISGGTVEETKELLDWCNRHGAGITTSAADRYVGEDIYEFLMENYPELGLRHAIFDRSAGCNSINGMSHQEFMLMLRNRYGN